MLFCKIGLFVGRDSYSMEANRKSHEFSRVRDKACFCAFTEITRCFSECTIDRTGRQTMLHLTCTMISCIDIARYGVSRAKDLCIWGFRYT